MLLLHKHFAKERVDEFDLLINVLQQESRQGFKCVELCLSAYNPVQLSPYPTASLRGGPPPKKESCAAMRTQQRTTQNTKGSEEAG